MDLIYILIAVFFAGSALLWRRKILGCPVADSRHAPASENYRLLTNGTAALDAARIDAIAGHASAAGLILVDILPADLPAEQVLALARAYHPDRYRKNRIAPPVSAGCALLVTAQTAERAGIAPAGDLEINDFFETTHRLKKHAATRAGLFIEPSLHAPAASAGKHERCCHILGKCAPVMLTVDLALLTTVLAGALAFSLPALIALVLFHFQPLIATARTALQPRDMVRVMLLRTPLYYMQSIRAILFSIQKRMETSYEDRREAYETLLAGGPDAFFLDRTNTCPLCGSKRLAFLIETPDLVFHKPGSFVLERCRSCGYIFQNPQLSSEGLSYYYRDAYDGIGAEVVELLLASSDISYRVRANLFKRYCSPETWLDVGAGNGYFCCVAHDLFPDTRFDGLDLSDGITKARQQGWVANAYREAFPDIAPGIAGTYDVVSMLQYLEHTVEPETELKAAHTALKDNGMLIIEVPNPDYPLRRILGRYWFQWLQPQHLHFFTTTNMQQLLNTCGFEPVGWNLTSAHAPIDCACAAVLFIRSRVPSPVYPWLRGRSRGYFLVRGAVLILSSPFILAGILIDIMLLPVFKYKKISNNYTFFAKKTQIQPARPKN